MEQSLSTQTFKKKERLCSRKAIEELFISGKSFFISPVKIQINTSEVTGLSNIEVLISVPKRNIRHATDRNRMKRLLRESYRKRKILLLDSCKPNTYYSMALLFTGKKMTDFKTIDSTIELLILQLLKSGAFLEK
ncbi:MAG: ribonuclease P protein component [Bacteroidetes bacterium]|nr:ribonuclease P protein component [Bacteroidota bacterium]